MTGDSHSTYIQKKQTERSCYTRTACTTYIQTYYLNEQEGLVAASHPQKPLQNVQQHRQTGPVEETWLFAHTYIQYRTYTSKHIHTYIQYRTYTSKHIHTYSTVHILQNSALLIYTQFHALLYT